MKSHDPYIPAAGSEWLTGFYDFLFSISMPEKRFRSAVVNQMQLKDGGNVLDLGCGTGSQLAVVKERLPSVSAYGVDGDIRILRMARKKMLHRSLDVCFQNGLSFQLPYFDNSFDCVISSLMFHHLTFENKKRTSLEIFRVLRTGGIFHLADFGKPHTALMRVASIFTRRLEQTKENLEGRLPEIIREAGFVNVQRRMDFQTIFGTLSLYSANKPDTGTVIVT